MNRKEKKFLNLKMLTNRVQRNVIDRRSFIKGAVAPGIDGVYSHAPLPGL